EFAKRYGAQGFGRSLYIHDPEGNVVELKPQVIDE
ncbi:VOC family protein, partial [Vibrio parahaemolyticus]|nr:VOC family protein [Vibrio alginolyticus]